MYSYAPFTVLSQPRLDGSEEALRQLDILYEICVQPSGLLVHGYDAIKNHTWADPVTGASPEVWSRAQAWYTLGLVNTIRYGLTFRHIKSRDLIKLQSLFNEIAIAQIKASEHSHKKTGTYGVWQVIDRPGAQQNFIEASSSFMTVYSLLAGSRFGLFNSQSHVDRAVKTAIGIYLDVSSQYLIKNSNGTLSLNGTSSVASLSGDVNYEVSFATVE